MSIVGYWRMNGNSNDASGTGNNGTDTNILYPLNKHASFNGSTSKIVKANNTTLQLNVLTISAYVYLKSYGLSANYYIRGIVNKYTTTQGYTLAIGTNATASGSYFLCFGANTKAISQSVFPLNKWVHVVGISTGTELYLYQDGSLIAQNSFVLPINTVDEFRIGNDYVSQNRSWDGFIKDVIIDNSTLPVSWVKNETARLKGFF